MSCPPLYPSITVLDYEFPLNPEDYTISDKVTATAKVKRGSLIQDLPFGQKELNLKLLGYAKSDIDILQAKCRQDLVNYYSGIEGDIQGTVDGYSIVNGLMVKVTPNELYAHEGVLYYNNTSLTIVSLRVDLLI
jgi:hypothetical protein